MPVILDPQGLETAALFEYSQGFQGKRVLEIGCGDGRLTWLIAEQAGYVVGIDPNAEKITRARNAPQMEALKGRIELHALDLQGYFATHGSALGKKDRFDLAILSWSL